MKRTALIASLLVTAALAAGPYEQPTDLKASQVLPKAIVAGQHSQVVDPVSSDGYLNVYQLKSRFSTRQVVSTATLLERAHEYDAIAQMDKLKGTQEFAKAAKGSLNTVVKGGENLVTNPVGTVKNTFNGIGRLFSNIGTAISGGGQSGGDGTISEVSGFAGVKRQYAKEFHVDPYSRNQDLQDTLSDISRAGFLGKTVTGLGLGQIGGAAGALITVSSLTKNLSDMVSQPPQTVADYCSSKLSAMGVSDDDSDAFLHNDAFTITERTAIVMALDTMGKTQNRQNFIKLALQTHDDDVAAFRRRQAELYAAYDVKQRHIAQFQAGGNFATAVLEDGTQLVIAPVDRLLWTEDMANFITTVSQNVTGPKQLWLSGSATPLALSNLKSNGWAVTEKAADKLK